MAKPKGYSRSRNGFRAWVRVGAQLRTKRFKAGDEHKIKNWRREIAGELAKAQPDAPAAGSFADGITRYLAQVKAMPTIAQRTEHLGMWRDALGGHLQRAAIKPEQIRAVLQQWRADGLSPATCNKRRTALMHLFTVLDGKDARNPVRAVPKFRPPDPLPRGRDPHAIDALLRKAPRCKARACERVMLWTGMRPVELERAQPEDIDLTRRTAIVRTGKGGRTRVVPLTPQGVEAWKEFAAAGCWEEPDNSPGQRTLKRGHLKRQRSHRIPMAGSLSQFLKKYTGMKDLRVYDLRHSYGTALARTRTRLDAIGALMGHSTLDLTRRYTLAAVEEEALAATARMARAPRRQKAKGGQLRGQLSKGDSGGIVRDRARRVG